jgi:hypothetical protein
VTVQNGSGNISGNNNMILNTPPTTGQPKGDAIPFSDQEVHADFNPAMNRRHRMRAVVAPAPSQ